MPATAIRRPGKISTHSRCRCLLVVNKLMILTKYGFATIIRRRRSKTWAVAGPMNSAHLATASNPLIIDVYTSLVHVHSCETKSAMHSPPPVEPLSRPEAANQMVWSCCRPSTCFEKFNDLLALKFGELAAWAHEKLPKSCFDF